LLSVPLNVQVLLALQDEPRSLSTVRKTVGSPPPTTMRGHLRKLSEIGILQRSRREEFPGQLDLALGPAGRGLLPVARALSLWLSSAPEGRVELGTPAAKSSIKALVEGWSHNIVRAIAARPLSLTELDDLIASLSYPSLERRLTAMRDVGQITARRSDGRGRPYAATEWLRKAIGPIVAAALWERVHVPEQSAPVGRLDVEATFLLAIPLVRLPSELSGACRLAVDLSRNGEHSLAGVVIDVREGEVVSCTSRLEGPMDAIATGSVRAWLLAVNNGELDGLEFSGERELAERVVDALHGALLRASRPL
jgi:DNA-binding HxlR family transcriptional regulator